MIDRFVVDDLILISGGKEISVESFQNEDGNRGASGWRVVGRNNGILGGESGQREIAFTGAAVWAVREDGKLLCNWSSVRRSSPQGRSPDNSRTQVAGRLPRWSHATRRECDWRFPALSSTVAVTARCPSEWPGQHSRRHI